MFFKKNFYNILKAIFYSSALIIFFLLKKNKKFIEVDFARFGGSIYFVEGITLLKKYNKIGNTKDIIFFSSFKSCNTQYKKMVARFFPLSNFNLLFIYLKKASFFWKINQNLFEKPNWNLNYILKKNQNKIKFSNGNLKFTEQEILLGKTLLKKFGLNDGDKWVCIHNRDEKYLATEFKNKNFSYHNHRDSLVQNMSDAAELFAKNNYFVFRMGKKQSKKLICKNYKDKIIDYAYSDLRSDFLDLFLIGNCDFYFGGDSGMKSLILSFMKPCYGVNWSPMLLYDDPGVFMNFKSNLHPFLFIFKRVRCLKKGKKLTLREILSNKVLLSHDNNLYMQNNLLFEENTREEIKNIANEILQERSGQNIMNKEDVKIKEEFWKIYFKTTGEDQLNYNLPKISPTYLRHNIDLLD